MRGTGLVPYGFTVTKVYEGWDRYDRTEYSTSSCSGVVFAKDKEDAERQINAHFQPAVNCHNIHSFKLQSLDVQTLFML